VAATSFRQDSGTTWRYWTSGTSSTAATVSISRVGDPWAYWIGGASGSSTTAEVGTANASDAFTYWCWMANGSIMPVPADLYQPKMRELTPEEVLKIEEDRKNYLAKREEEERQRQLANQTAEELLAEFLDAMQAKQWKEDLSFMVESETGRKFRIRHRGKVEELDEAGKAVGYHCIHIPGVPAADEALGRMLLLRNCEEEFRRIANFTRA